MRQCRIVCMAPGHQSLKDVLIAGLTATITDAEQWAASNPPYPTPTVMIPLREQILRELDARLPENSEGPPSVMTVLGPVQSYRSQVKLMHLSHGVFGFGEATCALIAVGALTTEQIEEIAPFLPQHIGFRRQLVLNQIADGDLEAARTLAGRIDDGYGWRSFRDIGIELARRGDARSFSPIGNTMRPVRNAPI
ncbi:hypothetical protein ACFXHA_17690 [Nocardia sp. NPDC059240]|uniref:hypothetical protein n=1 Tax=Nocardia sp. NPDC059240 TaxID=3346786 RepID=UPI003680359B